MSLRDIKKRQARIENRSEKGESGVTEGETFSFFNTSWDVWEAWQLIQKSPRDPLRIRVEKWKGMIGEPPRKLEVGEHMSIGLFYVNWDYVAELTEADTERPGIVTMFKPTPREEEREGMLIDGWHRLAKCVLLNKEFFPVYKLTDEENDKVQFRGLYK